MRDDSNNLEIKCFDGNNEDNQDAVLQLTY